MSSIQKLLRRFPHSCFLCYVLAMVSYSACTTPASADQEPRCPAQPSREVSVSRCDIREHVTVVGWPPDTPVLPYSHSATSPDWALIHQANLKTTFPSFPLELTCHVARSGHGDTSRSEAISGVCP